MSLCISPEIAEYMGFLVIAEHPDLREIVESWTNSSVPFCKQPPCVPEPVTSFYIKTHR